MVVPIEILLAKGDHPAIAEDCPFFRFVFLRNGWPGRIDRGRRAQSERAGERTGRPKRKLRARKSFAGSKRPLPTVGAGPDGFVAGSVSPEARIGRRPSGRAMPGPRRLGSRREPGEETAFASIGVQALE